MADYIHVFHQGTGPSEDLTILVCHGTGGDEHSLVPFAETLLPGASILSPRGNVLEGALPRFFTRLAEGVFDEDDLTLRAGQLARFTSESAAVYNFDPAKVVGFGYSNGANILHTAMLLHPGIASKLVLFRAMPTLKDPPESWLDGKKVFLSQGESDPIVTRRHSEALADLLTLRGAQVDLRWQVGGHAINRAEVVSAHQWLRQG